MQGFFSVNIIQESESSACQGVSWQGEGGLTKLQSLALGVGMPLCASLASSEKGSKGSFATTRPPYLHPKQPASCEGKATLLTQIAIFCTCN